jgi:hypothetical protein
MGKSMQVIYIGANHRQGTSERTGKAYSIAELHYAIPDESSVKKNDDGTLKWNYIGHGMTVRSINLDPNSLADFSALKPFTSVTLLLTPDPRNPSRNQVTGVKSA